MKNRHRIYEHYDKHFARRGRLGLHDGYFAPIQKPWLPLDKTARILDFACGIGETLGGLKASGYTNIVGVDATAVQIREAQKLLGEAVELHCQDGLEFLQQHPAEFDFIIGYDIIEHFTKDETLEVAELLNAAIKPGGYLVLKVPNLSALVGSFVHHMDMTHLTGFTELSLFQLLDATGFEDHQILDRIKHTAPCSWNIVRPWSGLGLRPRINIVLHRFLFWLDGTRPPNCFESVMEVWTHKPVEDKQYQ